MVKITEFHDMEVDKDTPMFAPLPFSVADDLIIYMRNDPMFYRRHFFPISDHIKSNAQNVKAIDRSNIESMINNGLVSYCKKFKIPNDPNTLLDKDEKSALINQLIKDELEN